MSNTKAKKAGIKPHVAMRALYVGAPKKFKLGDVPEGELVIVAFLNDHDFEEAYCVMIVQKKLAKKTRLFSVGLDEMTTYHSDTDRADMSNTEDVVWLVQATMPVARIPNEEPEEGEDQ
ncbi:MAG: hypothetical protein ACN6OP_19605 [Pseudomonadales bacterium]